MGRPERAIDPAAGPVQRLAHELRALRKRAGNPSYRSMAERGEFSVTTLSQAAAGTRLPSLAVVLAYAEVCGADPEEWEQRWKAAADAVAGVPEAAHHDRESQAPYRGLARFEPQDRAGFFGRERFVKDALVLVRENRFAALLGASGSGKSSLLRAGLVPRLQELAQEAPTPAAIRILTPGERPVSRYGHLLTPKADEPDSWVIVDQFEELFTLCPDPRERTRFIDLLLTAREPESRLHAVIAMRADFYARCAEHPGLADALSRSGLLMGPMSTLELQEAVTRPAAAAGLRVERELTARIVEEVVDRPGALPMFSHALLETWRRRRGCVLTLEAYEAAGGITGAIAATAESVYGQLSPGQAGAARRLMLRLIVPGDGAPDTSRPARRTELDAWHCPELDTAVERLAAARLLTIDGDTVQLAHEALITGWPRLQRWIDEDRERLSLRRRLTDAARTWHDMGRDPGALYTGDQLEPVAKILLPSDRDHDLCPVEKAYLTAALDARAAEQRTTARARTRTRRLVAAFSAMLAIALIVSMLAWQQHLTTEREKSAATAVRVAELAAAARTTDPRTALLLSLAAWRIAPIPEARAALFGALTQRESDAFSDPGAGVGSRRFLVESGGTLLSVRDRSWHTWDVATHAERASGRLPGTVLAADPDGRVVALDSGTGWRLWDTRTHVWTGSVNELSKDSYLPDFPASGASYLVSAVGRSQVQVRAVSDGRLLYQAAADSPANVTVGPGNRLVAACLAGGSLVVQDLGGNHPVPGAWTSTGGNTCGEASSQLAFDPAGKRLAAVSDNGVRVWDLTSGRLLADLDSPGIERIVFGGGDEFLAAAGSDEITVWNLSTVRPVFRHSVPGHQVAGLAWDAHHPLLRYLADGTVHTFDLAASLTPADNAKASDSTLLSPDGRTVATAVGTGDHYVVQLRDIGGGRPAHTLPAPSPPAVGSGPVAPGGMTAVMGFSPDGKTFTYGITAPGRTAARQTFILWDIPQARQQAVVDVAPRPAPAVTGVALSPGGTMLLTTRTDDNGRYGEVWETERGRRTAVLPGLDTASPTIRPDGRLLVGADGTAELPVGRTAVRALGRGEEVTALAFDADGSKLAVGDASGRVTLWDSDARHSIGTLPSTFPAPVGEPAEGVSALSFSPDGTTLAVGGRLGSIQLWDTTGDEPLGTNLVSFGESIISLSFAPDSEALYASSLHASLQRYPITPDSIAMFICAATKSALTPTEWHASIPDAPYRKLCPPSARRG
ncbi:helix-turn-helix domain-containing protein [Streptomyces sp. NPDC001663]|uniref:nSTAND1 domain-containing NTPase n=1 Tax=Streptomyces sp. NPDC001663 TaxID=3364597 RepID=UPI0036C35E9C